MWHGPFLGPTFCQKMKTVVTDLSVLYKGVDVHQCGKVVGRTIKTFYDYYYRFHFVLKPQTLSK